MLNVAFEDGGETVINMYFERPPTPGFYPTAGLVDVDDPRWYVFFYKFDEWMREGWPVPTYTPE